MKKNYQVIDWAGNLVFDGMIFDSFDSAWDAVREANPNEEDWQEFEVIENGETRESRYLDPKDPRATMRVK